MRARDRSARHPERSGSPRHSWAARASSPSHPRLQRSPQHQKIHVHAFSVTSSQSCFVWGRVPRIQTENYCRHRRHRTSAPKILLGRRCPLPVDRWGKRTDRTRETQPNRLTRSSARRCVYRRSIRSSLCPLIVETSAMLSPFSNKRLTASWRRSWK